MSGRGNGAGEGGRPVTAAYRAAQRQARLNGLQAAPSRIVDGGTFVQGFVPPDWLIDGVMQRSRLYACTSPTGHGKTAVWLLNACMVQAGRMLGSLEVTQGNALYLAGENPEDVKARLLGMQLEYRLRHNQLPYILPGSFPLDEDGIEVLRHEIDALGIPFCLIVGDTAASFFPGDDENDNVAAGRYARGLRLLTECDGKPAVIMLTHPVKQATPGNLLPRGGGAFLNELDGNFTLWSEDKELTTLHWQAKIRGPEFTPIAYQIKVIPTGCIDKHDRPVLTVTAVPVSEDTAAARVSQAVAEEDSMLAALRDHPDWSLAQIADHAGWLDDDGRPQRWKAQRTLEGLASDKLVYKPRRKGKWILTEKGLQTLTNL